MRLRIILIGTIVSIISLAFLLLPTILYKIPEQAIRFDPIYRIIDPKGNERTLPENSYLQGFRNRDYLPGVYHIIATLSRDSDSPVSGKYLYLIFPYIAGTAMSVSWNGQFLGSQGDMTGGNSNIWNSAKIFTMPAEYLRSTNILDIEIQGPYEAGLPREPYILPEARGALWTSLLDFFSEKIILIIIGALAVLGLVLILTGTGNSMKPNAMLFLGLASICTMLFLTDFMTLKTLPVPLLEFKRIVAIFRHLAAVFFLIGFMALSGDNRKRFSTFFIALQSLCILLLLLPRTMIAMKSMYSWTFLTIIPLPIYLMIRLLSRKNLNHSHMILIGGVAIASIMSIRDTLLSFLSLGSIYLSHYGFCIMIMAAAGFIVYEFMNQNRQLVMEQARAARFREESVRDPLTGMYNRNILDEVLGTLKRDFSLLVIDINDLKSINDTFGHTAGDEVLRDAAQIMKALVRKEDIIVRTGGDEFLIILPFSTSSRISTLTAELQARIAASPIENSAGTGSFFYSVSMGSASSQSEGPVTYQVFARLMGSADREMYFEKEKYRQRKLVNGA